MAEIKKIKQHNGDNYQSWKYNIKLILMERGLWSFIEGTENTSGQGAEATVVNAYHLWSDKAYFLIALRMNKSL